MTGFTDLTPAYDVPEFIDQNVQEVTLSQSVDSILDKSEIFSIKGDIPPSGNVISLKGQDTTFAVGDVFAMDADLTSDRFRITSILKTVKNGNLYTNLGYKGLTDDEAVANGVIGKEILKVARTQSACAEVPYQDGIANYTENYDTQEHTVENYATFDQLKNSLAFVNQTAKLKFFAKTPGTDGNSIDVAIANASDFGQGKYLKGNAEEGGLLLDNQLDYTPEEGQFAVFVLCQNSVVESFIVSFDETAKNDKSEFIFIETAINGVSEYILVSVNESLPDTVRTSLGDDIIKLCCGSYSEAGVDDIEDGYDAFSNKEELDIDIVIGNELDNKSAINLAMNRADCIAFIGATRACSVGLKAKAANTKTIEYRSSLNVDSKYVTLSSNYKYQYCSELGGNRWINLAGDIAGLKAQSNFNNYNWYAAAGLNRGNIKNVEKLAYSPDNSMRDQLYKNGINPVVIFPNTGAVLWGQKTLQTKASSFDRVNVVSLFNYLERSLARMSKYSLFEFNDEFQRNYIVSLIKPFLAQVKSGRGITDYLVICDTSNNTAQVIANNQMVIDIYIKPNYSAEFIYIRFTNVGTNDFSIVTGTA